MLAPILVLWHDVLGDMSELIGMIEQNFHGIRVKAIVRLWTQLNGCARFQLALVKGRVGIVMAGAFDANNGCFDSCYGQ